MMKKNGFISVTIIYTFFVVFLLTLFLIMASLTNSRIRLNIFKKDIKETDAKKVVVKLEDYIKNLSGSSFLRVESGTYRYVGKSSDVPNYLRFNGELWRIIGIVKEGYCYNDTCTSYTSASSMIKIIRDTSIGSLKYDAKGNNVGTSRSNDGSNDWRDSQLMLMLNPTLYKRGEYSIEGYSISDNHTPSVVIYRNASSYFNEDITPLKPAFTEKENGFNSIEEVTVCTTSSVNCLKPLTVEAQSKVATVRWNIPKSTNTTSYYWVGRVALPTIEDYLSASSSASCKTTWASSCFDNNWLLTAMNNQWTINYSGNVGDAASNVTGSSSNKNISTVETVPKSDYNVRPTLFLKPSVRIIKGTGYYDDPFIIN